MHFPTFSDLQALAAELERTGRKRTLRVALEQAWRAQSCVGDLEQAQDCCGILLPMMERRRNADTPDILTVERALLSNAISLYARATSTSGQKDERGSIQLEKAKLSPEEWADHVAILSVRNQALAHVYSSRKLREHEWHRDVFFAVAMTPTHWAAACASNQTSFHGETFYRLNRMVPVAKKILIDKFQKRIGAVTRMLNEMDDGKSSLLRHAFDPVKRFGTEEAVIRLLAAHGEPSTAFWTSGS